MAEEGVPPLGAGWSVEEVAAWVLTLEGIDDLEAVAAKVREEKVDGFCLLAYKDKLEVKSDLSLRGGEAARLFAAIEQLRAAPAAPVAAAGGTGGGTTTTAYVIHRPGSEIWTHAASMLQNTWMKHGLHEFMRLIEVKEIKNAPMRDRYEAYKAGMRAGVVNGNEMLVFHGCGSAAIESIAEKGFLKSFLGKDKWQRFGPGFYFALQASKSHEYPVAEMESVPVGQHHRTMILCKVARGKECKTDKNMDKLPTAPEGYDSVHGVATPDGPLNFDELVVYDERAILPYALVKYEYEKLASAPAPAPAVAEEGLLAPKPQPALQVTGAGTTKVNGSYTLHGEHNGKPKYVNLDDASISMVFNGRDWNINIEGSECKYWIPGRDRPMNGPGQPWSQSPADRLFNDALKPTDDWQVYRGQAPAPRVTAAVV